MNQSTNYKFNLPSDEDFYDINQQNENWNKADENLKNLEDKKVDAAGGDTAETIVSDFETSAENFPVPKAKEKAKTGWGKVKKFGEDFKAWMTGVCLLGHIVNNCVTNNPNLPLSAAQGKVLMDLYTVLNTNQKNKVDKTQLTGNGTTIHTLCLYKDINDGKLYLQVNWNEGIIYIRPDQIS